ncbi:MAG: serine/threonine protein kinase [Verrucomicrobia bacterium]|nr:serine/threonine protein kinase [Verrucomicrobiota bacterium]
MDWQKVKAIFTEAAGMASPAERAAYLDSACAGDQSLRAQVESFLADQLKLGDFLEPPFVQTSTDDPETVGTRIGPYKVLQKIGEGGFGIVYMAEQDEPIRRKVALKVIKAGMDTKQVIARFEAERQALAMMDHPNIARVFDAGETDTGRPYFVMELVKGIPLTEFCDRKKLNARERLELFIKVCQAVQHAHQKGIIHRDLKPSNVMITMLDGQPVPKVIDFGVAKAIEQRLTEKTLFTRYDQLIGTPAYMSPEQAELSGQDVDTRSDIYSLGVLLYELLTGTPPIDAETLRKAGLDEIRRLIRETDPPPPSTRLTQELVAADKVGRVTPRASSSDESISDGAHGVTRPTPKSEEEVRASSRRLLQLKETIRFVRGDLDWIVMKCLEKDRACRYETANGLAMDLQRHLNHEPVVARPPGNLYRFRKFARRNRIQVAFAASVAAALIVGLVFAVIGFAKARQERDRALAAERQAKAQQQIAQTEAARSAQVAKFLKDMLGGASPAIAQGRDTTILREILDRTAGRLEKELASQPDVEADLRAVLGQIYLDLDDYTNAAAMYERALNLRKRVHGDQHLDVAVSLYFLADLRQRQRRYAEAESLFREALAIRRKLLDTNHPDVARSLHRLASVLAGQDGAKSAEAVTLYAEAERLTRELLETRRAASDNEPHEILRIMGRLRGILMRQGKYAEAESVIREAGTLRMQLPEVERTTIGGGLFDLSGFLISQNRLHEAEAVSREVLAGRRRVFGDQHRETAQALSVLANVLKAQGRLPEAETAVREVLAIFDKIAPGSWETFSNRIKLGGILLAEKKYEEAEPLLLAGYEGIKQRGDQSPVSYEGTLKQVLQQLVQLYEETGQAKQAAEWKQKLAEFDQGERQKPAVVPNP